MQDQYDIDYEFDNDKFDDDFEVPGTLESWTLDELDDMFCVGEDFSF